jgi:hypothetical protein
VEIYNRQSGNDLMPTSGPLGGLTLRGLARQSVALAAWIATPDHLPPTPSNERRRRDPHRFSAWRDNRTSLPTISTTAPSESGFFSWLAASESLPDRTTSSESVGASFARWLLAGDRLDPVSSVESNQGDLEP